MYVSRSISSFCNKSARAKSSCSMCVDDRKFCTFVICFLHSWWCHELVFFSRFSWDYCVCCRRFWKTKTTWFVSMTVVWMCMCLQTFHHVYIIFPFKYAFGYHSQWYIYHIESAHIIIWILINFWSIFHP